MEQPVIRFSRKQVFTLAVFIRPIPAVNPGGGRPGGAGLKVGSKKVLLAHRPIVTIMCAKYLVDWVSSY